MRAASLIAAATVDPGRVGGNTLTHDCTAEQKLVVAALEGVGRWLVYS
jgi:hypothetical protein